MEKLKLVCPSKEYCNEVLGYKDEFVSNQETIHGSAGLEKSGDFLEWLENVRLNSCKETVKAGLVPSSTFICVRESDNRMVGIIDIRHCLNDYLEKFGGHIGYSIRKSERQQGYAKEMLRLALNYCRDTLQLDKVLITCDDDNIASASTMLANGAVLENKLIKEDGVVSRRYWIVL